MQYRGSEVIAKNHPELTTQVEAIDRYLDSIQGKEFRLFHISEITDIRPEQLQRIFELFQQHGILIAGDKHLCPEHHSILTINPEGELYCHLCDESYEKEACETETVYWEKEFKPSIYTPHFPKGYALLIGVQSYRHFRALPKALLDITGLYRTLCNSSSGYDPNKVKMISEPDKQKTSDALDKIARNTNKEDTVIIFFSGHGFQKVGGFEPGEYLCPIEANWDDLKDTAISNKEFCNAVDSINAGKVAIFLDACHSGGIGIPDGKKKYWQNGLSLKFFENMTNRGGRVIITSCGTNEVSWELPEMENSLFTHYLIKALSGEAADSDGFIRISGIYEYLSKKVPETKPDQHPQLFGNLNANFAIAKML